MSPSMPLMSGPQFLNWNYTYGCNLNCGHCYSRAASYPAELSTSQYLEIVAQIVEAQVFRVALGGGEVLLRADCTTILDRLARSGVVAMLTTNGWFVDDRWAGRLRDAGLAELLVSLDSPDAATHDTIRNRVGSHARALRALDAATTAGLDVYLSVVLSRLNVGAIGELVSLAAERGLRGINFKRFRPSGNGLVNKERFALEDASGLAIADEIERLRCSSGLDLSLAFGPGAGPAYARCGCGVAALALRPNGDVSACVYGEAVLGNLMERPLIALWRDAPELKALRDAGGCIGRQDAPSPSNPRLGRRAPEPLMVLSP